MTEQYNTEKLEDLIREQEERDRRRRHLKNIDSTRPDPEFFPLDPNGTAAVIERDPNRGTNRIQTRDGGTVQADQINNSSITDPVDYDADSATTDQRPHIPTVPLEEIRDQADTLPYIKILFGVMDAASEVVDLYVGGDRATPLPIVNRSDRKAFLPGGQYDDAIARTLTPAGAHLNSWGQDPTQWIASVGEVFEVRRKPLVDEREGAVESLATHWVVQGDTPDTEGGTEYSLTTQSALAGRKGIGKDTPDGVTDETEHFLIAYPQGWAEYRYNEKTGDDDPCCVGHHFDWVKGAPDLNRPFDRRPGWVAKVKGRNLNDGVIAVYSMNSGSSGKNFTSFAPLPDGSSSCSSNYGEPLTTASFKCDCSVGGIASVSGTVSSRRFNELKGDAPKSFCAGYFGAEKDLGFSVRAYASFRNERFLFRPILTLAPGKTATPLDGDIWWEPPYTVAENPNFDPYAVTGSIFAYRTNFPQELDAYWSGAGYDSGGSFEGHGIVGTGVGERCATQGLESALNPPPPPDAPVRDQCKLPYNASWKQFVNYKRVARFYLRDIENGLFCGAEWMGQKVDMCNGPIIPDNEEWCADPHIVARPLRYPAEDYPPSLPRDKDKKPVWKPNLIPALKSGYGLPDTDEYDTRISFPYRGLWEITSMEFYWCGEPTVERFIEGWQDGQVVYAPSPEEKIRRLYLPYQQAATPDEPWAVVVTNPEMDRTLLKRGNEYAVVLAGGQPRTLTLGEGVKAILDGNPTGINWERQGDRLWVVDTATFSDPNWAKSTDQATVRVVSILVDVTAPALSVEGEITALAIGPGMSDDQSIFSYSFHPVLP